MPEEMKNFIDQFIAFATSPEGAAFLIAFGVFIGIALLVMCFYGIYAIRVFKRQIADEPRIIPVLATLYHVVGFIIGLLYIGFIIGLLVTTMPGMMNGTVPDFTWIYDGFYSLVMANTEQFFAVLMTIWLILFVWSWIAIFDAFYTVFCPNQVREKYSGDIGDVLVRHRRWIVIPPLVMYGIFFIIYIVAIVSVIVSVI